MPHYQEVLSIATTGKTLHNITTTVQTVVSRSGIQMGLCTVFLAHTSASFVIQENADPDVLADLETFLARLVPEDSHHYRHSSEGADDMPAHIRTALTHTSETIPIREGQLTLGIWQALYLWEHRAQGRTREVVVHVFGDP